MWHHWIVINVSIFSFRFSHECAIFDDGKPVGKFDFNHTLRLGASMRVIQFVWNAIVWLRPLDK